jgi:hypothetical protein
MNILFIMYNIFDIRNGVSNKYINFIKSIENNNNNNISFIMTKNENNKDDTYTDFCNTKIYYTKGINIPFYDKIKIPYINDDLIKSIIKDEKYIIIFNGEFFWLYETLIDIKKIYNISLYPSWHTDYEEYFKKYVSNKININYMMNILYDNLKCKIFDGIIVTGEYTKNKFLKYTDNIFNANELCIDNFNFFKIDKYTKGETINFIYCGRVSIEKNIDEIFDILNNIDNLSNNYIKIKINIHIIGGGPYLEKLKTKYLNDINDKNDKNDKNDINNNNNKNHVYFYNELKYDEILNIYKKLDNRIFMYSDKNAFIYETKFDFINNLMYFLNLSNHKKTEFIKNSLNNINKYDQKIIFHEWEQFLLHNYNKQKECYEQIVNKTKFKKFLNLIQCSMNIISD